MIKMSALAQKMSLVVRRDQVILKEATYIISVWGSSISLFLVVEVARILLHGHRLLLVSQTPVGSATVFPEVDDSDQRQDGRF